MGPYPDRQVRREDVEALLIARLRQELVAASQEAKARRKRITQARLSLQAWRAGTDLDIRWSRTGISAEEAE